MNNDILHTYDLDKIDFEMKACPKTKVRIPRKQLTPKQKKVKRKAKQESQRKNRR
jgi:hypothetical protein